jgi:ATP-dependent RNA helicase RhlB
VSLACEEYVYSLEAIEQYIGQKVPVAWAEDDMYIREIRRTAEERQRAVQDRQDRVPPRPNRGRRPPDRPRR